MKLFLMPQEPTWWVWLITALLLGMGVRGHPGFFLAAIALSVGQGIYFVRKHRSLRPYAVQIRLGYAALLSGCFVPVMRWLYWLPTLGTWALVFFGYCLMARVLSLMPWNRSGRITFALMRRTFCAPPQIRNPAHGLPGGGCPGGVCELEARIVAR